jgi:hypothetical protein
MSEASARVIADSITEDGHRLTTVEAVCWRPLLPEQNTHRALSRNSASSRAIPVSKMLDRYGDESLDNPIVWPREKPGMQGGSELEGKAWAKARDFWYDLVDTVGDRIHDYVREHPDPAERLHKSLLNRWLEIGLWQTQIITATTWDGYFWQRCHEAAEPHVRAMAEAIQEALEHSEPRLLGLGEYHLPYFGESGGFEDDWDAVIDRVDEDRPRLAEGPYHRTDEPVIELAKRVSAGRCARVSHLNQAGQRDLADDLTLFTRLTDRTDDPADPPHASPLEHIATPWPYNSAVIEMPNGKTMGPVPRLGNFTGWWQFRHELLAF